VADAGHLRDDLRLVRHAACEGVADGLRQHLPGGVGIVVKGGATCVLCAVMHFGLGVDLPATVVSGSLAGAGLVAVDRWRIR
jgi:hypothetical protein